MIQIGKWAVYPQLNEIRGGGTEIALTALSMDVLVYLAQHADRVVTTEELLATFWAGKVVEQSTIHRRINLLRTALGDSSKSPEYIQTIPKRGYRLIAPVQDGAPDPTPTTEEPSTTVQPTSPSWRPNWRYAALGLLAVTVAALWYSRLPPPVASFDLQSVAVLRLQDLSKEQSLGWFGAGVAAKLNSRFRELGIVAVPSQMAINQATTSNEIPAGDLSALGARLGVETLVAGFVHRTAARDGQPAQVTVDVEVIDAASADVMWTTTAVYPESELSKLEGHVVNQLSGFLGLRIARPGTETSVPNQPEAYAAYTKFLLFRTQHELDNELPWIEETMRLAPDFAYGHLNAGWAYLHKFARTDSQQYRQRAHDSLQMARALGLEEHPQWQNAWGAYLSRIEGNHEAAEPFLRRAAEGGVIMQYVHLLLASGLPSQAASAVEKRMVLYPFEEQRIYLNAAYGMLGEYEAMLASAETGLTYAPLSSLLLSNRIFALIRLGRLDEARAAVQEAAPRQHAYFARSHLAHIAAAAGDAESARAAAMAFLDDRLTVTAGLILLEIDDPAAEGYLRQTLQPFYINLPLRIAPLSEKVKNSPAIQAIRHEYGFNDVWRIRLCGKAASLPAETGIQCNAQGLREGSFD